MNLYQKTVSSIAYTLCEYRGDSSIRALSPPYNDVGRFICDQTSALAPYLRLPMMIAVLLFSFSALVRGSLFHQLPYEVRLQRLLAWKNSSVGAFRDFIHYNESLSMMVLFSRREYLHEG